MAKAQNRRGCSRIYFLNSRASAVDFFPSLAALQKVFSHELARIALSAPERRFVSIREIRGTEGLLPQRQHFVDWRKHRTTSCKIAVPGPAYAAASG
ncbi:MAG: hypothetical protein HC802_01230 [Caldilineaceae bacterium]|nr:hypothetical protein [Caldilineaceae bacterium]